MNGVNSKNIPQLTLPTDNFDEMMHMSAGRLVTLLRSAVLSPERMGRFHPRPPAEHDAYRVQMSPNRIRIQLLAGGVSVFCVFFVPSER